MYNPLYNYMHNGIIYIITYTKYPNYIYHYLNCTVINIIIYISDNLYTI